MQMPSRKHIDLPDYPPVPRTSDQRLIPTSLKHSYPNTTSSMQSSADFPPPPRVSNKLDQGPLRLPTLPPTDSYTNSPLSQSRQPLASTMFSVGSESATSCKEKVRILILTFTIYCLVHLQNAFPRPAISQGPTPKYGEFPTAATSEVELVRRGLSDVIKPEPVGLPVAPPDSLYGSLRMRKIGILSKYVEYFTQ